MIYRIAHLSCIAVRDRSRENPHRISAVHTVPRGAFWRFTKRPLALLRWLGGLGSVRVRVRAVLVVPVAVAVVTGFRHHDCAVLHSVAARRRDHSQELYVWLCVCYARSAREGFQPVVVDTMECVCHGCTDRGDIGHRETAEIFFRYVRDHKGEPPPIFVRLACDRCSCAPTRDRTLTPPSRWDLVTRSTTRFRTCT